MRLFLAATLAALFSLTAAAQPPAPQLVKADNGKSYATGWNPEASKIAVKQWEARRKAAGKPVTFEQASPKSIRKAGANDPVFYWHSEKKVIGKVLSSWDQKQVGSCVGFGNGRATQDTMLNEVASGQPEKWPGAEVCPEIIYGGSRVEIGGGGLNGDGSVGVWARDWLVNYGVVIRGKYGNLDVTTYSESTCRRLGDQGIPADVEAMAKIHPITDGTMVTTADGLWTALGAGYGVPVCSGQGFTTSRNAAGFCTRSGTWNHCMCYRARFVHPTKGRCVVEQNSWDDYLGSSNNTFQYVAADGTTQTETLPMGCFCVELATAAAALTERDTFALAGLKGWEADPVTTNPTVKLEITPTSLPAGGGKVEVRWSSTDATRVLMHGTFPVALSGTQVDTLTQTTGYTITAYGATGTTPATAAVTVTVGVKPPPPDPTDRVARMEYFGQTVVIDPAKKEIRVTAAPGWMVVVNGVRPQGIVPDRVPPPPAPDPVSDAATTSIVTSHRQGPFTNVMARVQNRPMLFPNRPRLFGRGRQTSGDCGSMTEATVGPSAPVGECSPAYGLSPATAGGCEGPTCSPRGFSFGVFGFRR